LRSNGGGSTYALEGGLEVFVLGEYNLPHDTTPPTAGGLPPWVPPVCLTAQTWECLRLISHRHERSLSSGVFQGLTARGQRLRAHPIDLLPRRGSAQASPGCQAHSKEQPQRASVGTWTKDDRGLCGRSGDQPPTVIGRDGNESHLFESPHSRMGE
jgi:hypothetical protein